MKNNLYCVIMAGGKGERFWPKSREDQPKQLIKLLSSESMLEQTVDRVRPLLPPENILILTNVSYVDAIRKLLPELPAENIIGEPARRDTAPCVALAAGIVKAKSGNAPEAVMMLLPADHCIVNAARFRADLQEAVEASQDGSIVTIGIPPTGPSSDYGYIDAADASAKVSAVNRFVEKPAREKAVVMLETGHYYWNAGMFFWQIGTIEREFSKHTPQLAAFAKNVSTNWAAGNFESFLASEFPKQEKISIDYALLEKSSLIKVVKAEFSWDDLGNWTSLRNHLTPDEQGNITMGNVKLLDCKNAIVISDDAEELVTAIDMESVIVIRSGDATLVCNENSGAKIKKLLALVAEDASGSRYL